MRRKLIIALVATPVLLVVLAVLYLSFADLSRYRSTVERIASDALGRPLRIGGQFDIRPALSPMVHAEQAVLTNPPWFPGPAMAEVERLQFSISLWSLISGPVRFNRIEAEGVQVHLVRDAQNRASWDFDVGGPSSERSPPNPDPRSPVLFADIAIRDAHVTYDDEAIGRPLAIDLTHLNAHIDRDGMQVLDLDGWMEGRHVTLAGRVGRADRMFTGREFRADVQLTVDSVTLAVDGRFADLGELSGPDLRVRLNGPDASAVHGLFGMPDLGPRPFDIALRASEATSAVKLGVAATLGRLVIRIDGHVASLLEPERFGATFEAGGPDLQQLGSWFGEDRLPAGPFSLTGAGGFDGERITLDGVEASVAGSRVKADGDLGWPPRLSDNQLELTASSDDLSVFDELAGIELPPVRFTATCRASRRAGRLAVEALDVRLGEIDLSGSGELGELPELLGSDVELHVRGPRLAVLSKLAGLELPAEPFALEGRFQRVEQGIAFQALRASLGAHRVSGEGTVVLTAEQIGTDVRGSVEGPELSLVEQFGGPRLVVDGYRVAGGIAVDEQGFLLEQVDLGVSDLKATVDGRVGALPTVVGTDVRVEASGGDLSRISDIAEEIPDLPGKPYQLKGRVKITADGYGLENVTVQLGDARLEAQGTLGALPELEGTDLQVDATGDDLSWLADYADLELPAKPYEVAGRWTVAGSLWGAQGVRASLGDLELTADGTVGAPPSLDGTEIRVEASGPRLSDVTALDSSIPPFPEQPFEVRGGLGYRDGVFRLTAVEGNLGEHDLSVDGPLGTLPDLEGFDLTATVKGEDVRDLVESVVLIIEETLDGTDTIPRGSYDLAATVRKSDDAYELRATHLRTERATLEVDGRITERPDLTGTDLTLRLSGADASPLGELVGVELPRGPFRVTGELERLASGVRFHDVDARLGEFQLQADGTLGEPPKLVGTNLTAHVSGPSLAWIGRVAELGDLPDLPFEVDGHLDGNPERFMMQDMRAQVGESDLAGSFHVDLTGTPEVTGDFVSKRFNLRQLRGLEDEAVTEVVSPGEDGIDVDLGADHPPSSDKKKKKDKEKGKQQAEAKADSQSDAQDTKPAKAPELKGAAIPDTPIETEQLSQVNGDVTWKIGRFTNAVADLSDIDLGVELHDGRLKIGPFSGTGRHGGTFSAGLLLEPVDDRHRLNVELQVHDARINVTSHETEPELRAPLDLELHFDGIGQTPREILASGNGWGGLDAREGRMDSSVIDLIGADLLRTIFDLLNPFRKETPYTLLECAVFVFEIEDGVTRLDPLALRTDKVTVVGNGRVNFNNEKIDLNWTTKPRKGIGVSASALTNPYIKVGGTLSKPALELDPARATVATGAAVATAGLSILGKGLWDRITAGKKVCQKAQKEAHLLATKHGATPSLDTPTDAGQGDSP